MTLLWQYGFDLYNVVGDLNLAYYSYGPGSFSTTGGRFGGGGWSSTGYGITRAIPANAEIWSSFAMETSAFGTGANIVAGFSSAGGIEGLVTYQPASGTWTLWRGGENTSLGSATYMLPSGTWHWIDIHFKMHATAGVFELWIDETQVLNLTAQDTIQNSGQTTLAAAYLGDGVGGGGLVMTVDDWFIYTPGSRYGDSRIETLVPTSDATPNNGTPSTGTTHYNLVNEAGFNTTNYVTMPNTSGDKEVYGHGALVNTPPTVHAVAVKLVSQKSDAGAYSLEPLVVSSSTEGDGSAQALTTSWGIQTAIFEQDPHTSAAWAYSAVNSASIGYRVP